MDVIEAIHTRRSVRAYSTEPVERAILEALIWDAAQAPPPTAAYRRPWRFHVVEGEARLEALGVQALAHARAHPPPGWRQEWLEEGSGFRVFWGAPALILITCPAQDVTSAWDCCRAAQALMISAHARGLGSCWVGSPMPWLADPSGKAAMGMTADYGAVAPIIVGHPAGPPPPAPDRQKPEVVWLAAQ
jgi:nitroreductase